MALIRIVLAVEDDLQEQLAISRAASELADPVRVVTVVTGGDALDYVYRRGPFSQRRPDEDPHLIVADHELPDMLGCDLVRGVREHEKTKDIPVIVYASGLNGDARRYEGLSVQGPLPKQSAEDLKGVLQDAIRRSLNL